MTSHPGPPGIAPGTGGLRVELFDMRLEDVLRGDGSAATANKSDCYVANRHHRRCARGARNPKCP